MELKRELTERQRALLWFSAAEVTAERVRQLTEEFGSPEEVYQAFGRENGPQFQARACERLKKIHPADELSAWAEKLEQSHVHLLFSDDEEYPKWLRTIDDFPYLLYYAGRLSCMKAPMVGIVGARKASAYGKGMAHSIARGLAEAGVTVVSGLARGIDGAAHQGALDADGSTIGILGSGINVPYPSEHAPLLRKIAGGKGLILSEYPLDAEPVPFHFPYRNRIISGLSLGVVFVEGEVKSGGMLTVHEALTQGREVFAVPGLVGTKGAEGPHAILREGARIVTSAQDLLDDLNLLSHAKQHQRERIEVTDPVQKKILQALQVQPLTVDQLSQELSMSAGELLVSLSMMEINGLIQREAGNTFFAVFAPKE